MRDAETFVAGFRIRRIQRGHFLDRFDDRPGHQVGIRNLALSRNLSPLINQAPVLVDHLHWHRPLAGRDRHGQARRHVLGDAQGRSAQFDQLIARGCHRRDGCFSDGCDGHGSIGRSRIAVRFKYLLPIGIDGLPVVEVLVIQLVFEPAINTGFWGLRHANELLLL